MKLFNVLDFISYDENPVGFVLFVLAIMISAFIVLFMLIYPFAKARYDFKNFQKIYYKEIKKIADLNDYYLINKLSIRNNNQLICRIDHVLFGDKYIYVIKDRYYRGTICGSANDNAWLFYTKGDATIEIQNPMKVNEKRVDKLSLATQIDMSFFISIVIINDNCVIKNSQDLMRDNNFIVSKKNLKKLIKTIEKRNVSKMDPKQLEYAVQDISRLYGQSQKMSNDDEINGWQKKKLKKYIKILEVTFKRLLRLELL